MKPRKIQILKNFLSNDEKAWTNPLNNVILEGLIRLFEWDNKMLEVFPVIDPDIVKIIQETARSYCPGYLCSFSNNYMIKDQTAAEPFEASEEEMTRNIFNLAFLASCSYVRDLAIVYRSREDVRKLVDDMIKGATSEAKEKRSFQNILSKMQFMDDFQREMIRNQIIHNFKEESK